MLPLIATLLEELQQKLATFSDGVPRETSLADIPNKILVAIGMRRTGKTYFLLQTIEKLLHQGIPHECILYANFEDDRLYPFTTEKLSQLLDSFYTLYPENHQRLCYLFLDEIQNIEQWHKVIRRYFDNKKVKIYLTGSSAKLLSKEIATSLRGRSIATEIWPFSFTESLQAKQLKLPQTYGKINLDKVTLWLKTYLQQGGFPETTYILPNLNRLHGLADLEQWIKKYPEWKPSANAHDHDFDQSEMTQENRRRILQDYVSAVIFRDIVERHNITNIEVIKYLIKTLLKNVGSPFSAHKFHKDLTSQGLKVAKTTIYDYLGYLEDVYLAFAVPLYSESLRKVHSNPRKIYAIDTGLVNACVFSSSENIGHHFENLIYLDLRRAQHQVYYYLTATRKEVDFLTQDPLGKWHLFQVCWDMQDTQTIEREMSALQEAAKELKKLKVTTTCITSANYVTVFLSAIRQQGIKS